MPQGVRPDGLGDPGTAGDPADNPPGAVPVQPPAISTEEDRALAPLADGQVDRARGTRRQGDGDHLSALTCDHQGPVAAFHTQGLNFRAGGLRDPQPVQRQQRDQRMLGHWSQSGRDQQGAHLVAVQSGGVRLVVQPRPADMDSREWFSSSSSTAYR